MSKEKGEALIENLLGDPDMFFKYGKSNDLLQEYFRGLNIETLVPLLDSKNEKIVKPAIWIVSELASKSCSLLKFVTPLIRSKDKYIRYYSFECILSCARGDQVKEFKHLLNGLIDEEITIRVLVMGLLCKAEEAQLTSVELADSLDVNMSDREHYALNKFLSDTHIEEKEILDMLDDSNAMVQKYGVIIGKRKYNLSVDLLQKALLCGNDDVIKFVEMMSE